MQINHIPPKPLQRAQVIAAMRDTGVETADQAVAWCLQFLQEAAHRLCDPDCDPLCIADEIFVTARVAADYASGKVRWEVTR